MKRKGENILRDSFPLFSASFVAQGINFLLVFLLPFYYSTQAIGQFFVFSALALLVGPLVSLRSFNAILISESKSLAELSFRISIIIGGGGSILFGGILYLISTFPVLDISEKIGGGLLFLPVFVFLISVFISFENWLNYKKKYTQIGYSKLIKTSVTFSLILIFGIYNPSVSTIIIAFVVGQLVAVLYQIYISGFKWNPLIFSLSSLKCFFSRFKAILIFNSSLAVVSELSSHLPTVLLSFFYGDSVVAFYGMAQRFFFTPASVFSSSIAVVFGKNTAEYVNNFKSISGYFYSTITKMLRVLIPFGVVGFLLAPFLMESLFGAEWEVAGMVSRIIIPLVIIQNTIMPVTILYTILNYQKQVFWFYLRSFFIRIMVLFILPYYLFDISYLYLLILFSFSGIVHYFLYYRGFQEKINAYERDLK